ncbi:cingulin isoform X2 [Poeciliopsis prolifica]|uniref:cingulin isoform X2 n=1 Tax=Poeciliopsis prolifica TaxID=188132 RepID=UPI0024134B77|nr:cingulin isoform X2 [Poeciliopsis prolifica]
MPRNWQRKSSDTGPSLQEAPMGTPSTDRKAQLDYGVQIRFIKDLHDTGGVPPEKSRASSNATPPSSKYGVAVRVQGISGQPYVVLKDGEKGDSYGVQLSNPNPTSGPTSPYNSIPKRSEEPADFPNSFSPVVNPPRSPVSPAEDEDGEIFGSPLRRPPGDGQAGTQGDEEGRAGRERRMERPKPEPQLKATPSKTEKKINGTDNEEYNEAGLKPVKLKSAGPKGFNRTAAGFTGSVGRKPASDSPPKSIPEPPPPTENEPAAAIDTNSLAPINKLINKFNSSTPGGTLQARGRTGARQRLQFDERKRSRSFDAWKDSRPQAVPASPSSPALNPHAEPMSAASSPVMSSAPATTVKATAPNAPKASFKPPEKFAAKDSPPTIAKKPETLSRSLSQNTEIARREEAQVKQSAYNIFKDGSTETEASFKRKSSLAFETPDRLQKGGSDESVRKEKLEDLHKQLERYKKELERAQDELAAERMAREVAESRLRLQEDQLAHLQEELRRVSENLPQSDSFQSDVTNLQARLAEAAMLYQRQEEVLHQRERELTALKGALKEEVECHDKEMEALREQFSQDMKNLRKTMEEFTQSQAQIEEEREKVNASLLTLEEELESSREQGEQWRTELEAAAQKLHSTREELKKSRLEKEKVEGSLKDLQNKQPASDDANALKEELRRCHDDLKRTRADLERQKGEAEENAGALEALKKASGEKEAELLSEISKLREQFVEDKAELEKALETAKEASVASAGTSVVDGGTTQELQQENTRLKDRLARMQSKLQSSVPRSSDAEEELEALEDENRSLKSQLEEAKRGATRLSKERDDLTRRLEERDLEREALRRGKSDLEEQKRLLDRSLEKINKEMELMMGDSRQSVATLQTQLDEFRERSRKDLLEAQRNSKDRLAELQRAQNNLKAQQEEVSRLKKELLTCSEERDSAQLERDLLNNRLKHLENELESERSSHSDRGREIRGLEDKIKTLEIELDEEKSGVELLNDRITRSRDQVDQLRSELMQERSERHDLEMDKSALERQVKELKSRLADMEGQSRPTAGITLLENKIQELEERLRSEEREKTSIQASQRRAERKLKELNATLDQERSQHIEQRDQLTLRVKALKRQLDESEGEVERLEGVRRKVLRDLEEQQELQEALQAKVAALENDLKRKSQQTHRLALTSSALSSDEEDGPPS